MPNRKTGVRHHYKKPPHEEKQYQYWKYLDHIGPVAGEDWPSVKENKPEEDNGTTWETLNKKFRKTLFGGE